ncbi:MAG: hypothetical protein GQ540_03715 [Lutibacter sp.]|uniref:hypothetical protein n=1 Tax=Lutibacter sp. TaxID=1925666 RepID=UPI0019FA9764|nr:hypothetical protein [Lutibacter sp.]NOR27620.1 hypothetical protein [Lutibacter sp.]
MSKKLRRNKVETITATDVVITNIEHDFDHGKIQIGYLITTETGKPIRRGRHIVKTPQDITDLYINVDAQIATGKTSQEALIEAAYDTILDLIDAQ